jgi:alkylhydroperoxidase family enzyme
MSWIREIDPDALPEDVRPWATANVIRVLSINPNALSAVVGMNRGITFGASALSRVEEEAIATAVSAVNKCQY